MELERCDVSGGILKFKASLSGLLKALKPPFPLTRVIMSYTVNVGLSNSPFSVLINSMTGFWDFPFNNRTATT